MRDKFTPLYSAFSLVSIESIWPNSNGSEVPINFLDVSYLNERLRPNDSFYDEFLEDKEAQASTLYSEAQTSVSELTSSFDDLGNFYEYSQKIETQERVIASSDDSVTPATDEATITAAGVDGSVVLNEVQEEKITVNNIYVSTIIINSSILSEDPYRLGSALSKNESFIEQINNYINIIDNNGSFNAETISFIDNSLRLTKTYNLFRAVYNLNSDADEVKKVLEEIKTGIEEMNEKFKDIISSYVNDVVPKLNQSSALTEQLTSSVSQDDYGIYPQSSVKPGFNNILSSEDAYKKRKGYFKIIPLNVVSVKTSTSLPGDINNSGSTFDVSFTLDDLLIFADDFASQEIQGTLPKGTAVPVDIESVFDEFSSYLSNDSLLSEFSNLTASGLTSFRVSGDYLPFTIEDLIETNDTVTIWTYHDPKEFDTLPYIDQESTSFDSFTSNKDLTYVIGDGSRKSQDDYNLSGSTYTPPRTLAHSTLMNADLLDNYLSPESLAEETVNPPSVSIIDVFSFVEAAAETLDLSSYEPFEQNTERTSLTYETVVDFRLEAFYTQAFNSRNSLAIEDFKSLMKTIYLPIETYNRVNTNNRIPDSDKSIDKSLELINKLTRSIRETLNKSGDELLSLLGNPNTIFDLPETYYLSWQGDFSSETVSSGDNLVLGDFPVNQSLFQKLLDLRKPLSELIQSSTDFLREQNQVTQNEASFPEENNTFFNKRRTLSSSSHGETCYLNLKGHVQSVSSTYNYSNGGHIVTLTGQGYEKVIKEHILYYEDLFAPKIGSYARVAEGNFIYSNTLAPKAILYFLETNAPRFFLVGRPSGFSLDAKNLSLQFSRSSIADEAEDEKNAVEDDDNPIISSDVNITEDTPDVLGDKLSNFIQKEEALVRGSVVVEFNVPQGEAYPDEITNDGNIKNRELSLRLYYPVNYINTSRMREMIDTILEGYRENPQDALFKIPIQPESGSPISQNLERFNGPSTINHMFIDETGRFRQRIAFEALERTPDPQYIPIINETNTSNISFSKDTNSIINVLDLQAQFFGNSNGVVNAYFPGRTITKGNDYVPFNANFGATSADFTSKLFQNDYEVISESLFRYGLRYNRYLDIYSPSEQTAEIKSGIVQSFYDKPIKQASVEVRGDPSYRAGETTLVCLPKSKYRSKAVIDVKKMIDWLEYLREDKELREMYIGVDTRWLNNDYYYLTSNLDDSAEYSYWVSKFKEDPYLFVLDQFIKTLGFVKNKISSGSNLVYITPEYFPTTYWAFTLGSTGDVNSKFSYDQSKRTSVLDFYSTFYDRFLGKDESNEKLVDYLSVNPNLLNAVKMQNFRCSSYYVEGVSHSYVHGSSCSTSLKLTHGQDNLVLLEPFSMKPIGFISAERKVMIGYDDVVIGQDGSTVYQDNPDYHTTQRRMWRQFKDKKSDIQTMYIKQFYEDKTFKNLSFLYNSQKNRNSANFMYEIALTLGLSD